MFIIKTLFVVINTARNTFLHLLKLELNLCIFCKGLTDFLFEQKTSEKKPNIM